MHGNHYLRTDGTVVYYGGPTVVIVEDSSGAPLDGVLEIYQGTRHGCGLRSGGTVWCWGLSASANTSGELGNGTFTATATLFRATQVQMDTGSVSAALTNVTHLSGGSSRCYLATNTCAVRGDGSLYCWGSADASGGGGGTLFNDGVVGARNLATPILAAAAVPLDGVEAVSLGGRHACVLRNGGEVWCWAANVGGPLGQGDETGRVYPVRVTLPGAATKVGAGADVTCALVSGSVYCWGSNNSGQVGIGLPSANSDGCINFCKRTPAQVIDASAAPLGGVLDLNVAYLSVCATLSDHSLLCWGAGIANVATPFAISATPVVNVAQHTSCGSSQLDSSIRFLTRDDQLRTPFGTTTQQCP